MLAVLIILRLAPQLDLAFFDAQIHLIAVSAIAVCALLTAAVAVVSAKRANHPGSVWLAIGCSAVGILMLGHGLVTPGQFGNGFNLWVSRFPHLAFLILGIALLLAGRRADWGPNQWVRRRPLSAAIVALIPMMALTAAASVNVDLLLGTTGLPQEENIFDVISLATVVMLALAITTHWRRWQLGRDIVQFAIVLAAAMSIAAVTAFQHGKFGQISWWDCHGFLLAGFGAAVYAVFRRGVSQQAISDVVHQAFDEDPFDHIQRGYPEVLRRHPTHSLSLSRVRPQRHVR